MAYKLFTYRNDKDPVAPNSKKHGLSKRERHELEKLEQLDLLDKAREELKGEKDETMTKRND